MGRSWGLAGPYWFYSTVAEVNYFTHVAFVCSSSSCLIVFTYLSLACKKALLRVRFFSPPPEHLGQHACRLISHGYNLLLMPLTCHSYLVSSIRWYLASHPLWKPFQQHGIVTNRMMVTKTMSKSHWNQVTLRNGHLHPNWLLCIPSPM